MASGPSRRDSVEQVQQVVKVANQFKIPGISSDRDRQKPGIRRLGARVFGQRRLDLKRMNRILDVSERDQTRLVSSSRASAISISVPSHRGTRVTSSGSTGRSRLGRASIAQRARSAARYTWRGSIATTSTPTAAWRSSAPTATIVRNRHGRRPKAKTWQLFKLRHGAVSTGSSRSRISAS